MPNGQTTSPRDRVKDFAEAFGLQSRLSNRLWLVLISVVFIVVLPIVPTGSDKSLRELPFHYGAVEAKDFDIIALPILAVLTIAFCQAHAQVIRAYRFAQENIDKLEGQEAADANFLRLDFDLLGIPTLTRVAPLPQLLLSDGQRLSSRNRYAAISYVVLKAIAFSVIFGMPLYGLVIGLNNLLGHKLISAGMCIASILAAFLGMIALLTLLFIAGAEVRHTAMIAGKFDRGEL